MSSRQRLSEVAEQLTAENSSGKSPPPAAAIIDPLFELLSRRNALPALRRVTAVSGVLPVWGGVSLARLESGRTDSRAQLARAGSAQTRGAVRRSATEAGEG